MVVSPDYDPTAIELTTDPERQRMSGVAYHGNTPFDVPFISRITDDLWQGGCEDGLVLPREVKHVVSLYPWEEYTRLHVVDSWLQVRMYDSDDDSGADEETLVRLAKWINECRKTGVTLVHCQAGLNRSSLLTGLALVLDGMTATDAIELLRKTRSPAVLCNRAFEQWLLEFDQKAVA
jgi:protein-tyrosine phosphatase